MMDIDKNNILQHITTFFSSIILFFILSLNFGTTESLEKGKYISVKPMLLSSAILKPLSSKDK